MHFSLAVDVSRSIKINELALGMVGAQGWLPELREGPWKQANCIAA
jgi:hypothetical protein